MVAQRLVLLISAIAMLTGCGLTDDSGKREPASTAAGPAVDWFVDVSEASGLAFRHFNGMTGEFYYPEIMAPGVALLDYDNDGDLDVFAVQGRMLGGGRAATPPAEPLKGRLFRNDVKAGGPLRFTDVTAASRIDATGYGMGAATGDFDNNGCVDLYVTNLGSNQLLRNNCDGTFADVTKESRTASPGWGISAAFVDVNRDGWLDLFVGHYLNYSIETNIRCHSASGQLDYCPPQIYRALPSRLFRNNRDGTFSDVTAAAGMAVDFGPTMGVSTADFNGDGWIDIYLANDSSPNILWINQRDGSFKNTALAAGAAVGPEGQLKASMGVDAGDFDNDGDEDIFITELTTQGVDLYVNDGTAAFTDESSRAGLRVPTLPFTGFGAAWLDVDNDGWLDVATVNGLVTHREEALTANDWFGLRQRRQLFRGLGNGRFEDASDRAGAAFAQEEVGRGAAFGDIDNDGDTDILVANDSGPLRVLVNTIGSRNHWIGLRLIGRPQDTRQSANGRDSVSPAANRLPAQQSGPRDMVGARVMITRADASVLWRRARADGSYGSANDPRVLAGLGTAARPPRVRVYWPGGAVEEWKEIGIDADGSASPMHIAMTSEAAPQTCEHGRVPPPRWSQRLFARFAGRAVLTGETLTHCRNFWAARRPRSGASTGGRNREHRLHRVARVLQSADRARQAGGGRHGDICTERATGVDPRLLQTADCGPRTVTDRRSQFHQQDRPSRRHRRRERQRLRRVRNTAHGSRFQGTGGCLFSQRRSAPATGAALAVLPWPHIQEGRENRGIRRGVRTSGQG